jgi:hypothetical protein
MSDTANQNTRSNYLELLTAAIESFTNGLIKETPRAFYLSNCNLQAAAERDFFFKEIGNECLWEALEEKRKSVGGDLPQCLLAAYKRVGMRDGLLSSMRQFSFSILRVLKITVENLNSPWKRSYTPKTGMIAVFVNHAKFLTLAELVFSDSEVEIVYVGPFPRPNDFVSRFEFVNLNNYARTPRFLCRPLSLCPSVVNFFDRSTQFFKEFEPRAAVAFEGNSPNDSIVSQIAKQAGIPSVCIQQGWSPTVHSGFRNLSFDKMLIWGSGFEEILKPFNPGQKFEVTGSPFVETCAPRRLDSIRAIGFFLQSESPLISKVAREDFWSLLMMSAREFPAITHYVRPHPGAPLSEKETALLKDLQNVKVTQPARISLREFFKLIDLSVTIYSTTALESLACGIIPLIVNLTPLARYSPDLDQLQAAVEVNSVGNAFKFIKMLEANPTAVFSSLSDGMNTAKKHFFAGNRSAAVRDIRSLVESFASARK